LPPLTNTNINNHNKKFTASARLILEEESKSYASAGQVLPQKYPIIYQDNKAEQRVTSKINEAEMLQ